MQVVRGLPYGGELGVTVGLGLRCGGESGVEWGQHGVVRGDGTREALAQAHVRDHVADLDGAPIQAGSTPLGDAGVQGVLRRCCIGLRPIERIVGDRDLRLVDAHLTNDHPDLALRNTVAGAFEALGAIELRLLDGHGALVVGLCPRQAFEVLVRTGDEAVQAVGESANLAVELIDLPAPLASGDDRLAGLIEQSDHRVEIGGLTFGEVLDTGLGSVAHREVDPASGHGPAKVLPDGQGRFQDSESDAVPIDRPRHVGAARRQGAIVVQPGMAQRAGEAMVGRFGDLEEVRLVAEVGHIRPGDGAGTAPTEEEGAPHDRRQASRHA